MQKTFLGVLILLLFSCILSLTFWFFTPATINFDEEDPFALDLDEVRNLSGQNSILWVDARSEEEFIKGAVDNSVLLNEESWESLLPGFLDKWTPEKMIVVYCSNASCSLSRDVAARIRNELGLDSVYYFEGNWSEIVKEGL
jgi:rhodanese-related sulfurtransferase